LTICKKVRPDRRFALHFFFFCQNGRQKGSTVVDAAEKEG